MAYQNQQNGDFQQVHVTSNSLMLFSGDMSIRVSLYDQALSLSFTPALTDSSTGKRKFPKENATNVLLTAERTTALYDIITHRTLNAIENKTPRSDAISCNKDGSTLLSVNVNSDMIVELVVYTGIEEDRIPKKTLKFVFQDIIPINNFNPATGEFVVGDTPIRAQLLLFIKLLAGFLTACAGAEHHFGKYNDRFSDRRFMGSIDAMATKLGVNTTSNPQYNNGTNVSMGGAFNANNSTSTAGVPVTEVNDIGSMFNMDAPQY